MNASNLPSVFRFKREDYPDAPEWFGQFLGQLNLYTNPVYSILNGGVTFQNLATPQIYSLTITASSQTRFTFQNPLRIPPSAVLVGNVYVSGAATLHPSVPVQVMWHLTDKDIIVDDVVGLTIGTKYFLTLVVV